MARPQSVSDDEILAAAHKVLVRCGDSGFSVSQVARELGLSRTAIMLRFESPQNLKSLTIKRASKKFEQRIQELKLQRGPEGLLAIADMIATMAGRNENSNFTQGYVSRMRDPVLSAREEERGATLRAIIAKAMPPTALEPSDAADAFMAHISGSLMNWESLRGVDAKEFLRDRTLKWLRLVGIEYEGQ